MIRVQNAFLTCAATASPSARREIVNQICKQIWNAAMQVGPCRAAIDAANVTQHVTAITLASNKDPESKHTIWAKHQY